MSLASLFDPPLKCDICHESEGIDYPGKVVHLEITEWEYKHFCSMDCAEEWMKEEGF